LREEFQEFSGERRLRFRPAADEYDTATDRGEPAQRLPNAAAYPVSLHHMPRLPQRNNHRPHRGIG